MGFESHFLIWGFMLLAGASGCFALGRWYARLLNLFEGTETTPVSRVTAGFVKVKGRVNAAGQVLFSPMSGQPCVFYRFHVEQKVRRRRKSRHWVTVIDDKQECGLLVEDGQGSIRVNVRAARLMLRPAKPVQSGFLGDAPPGMEATLSRYGQSSQGLVLNKPMRYSESLLRVDDPILVLGQAQVRDGRMVIDSGGDNFIVSDRPEEELTRSFRRRKALLRAGSILMGAGAAFLSLLSVVDIMRPTSPRT